jgi:hypothetical protein
MLGTQQSEWKGRLETGSRDEQLMSTAIIINNQPSHCPNVPTTLVATCSGMPTKSFMSFVKQEVAQLSIAIWNESLSYRIVGAAPLDA